MKKEDFDLLFRIVFSAIILSFIGFVFADSWWFWNWHWIGIVCFFTFLLLIILIWEEEQYDEFINRTSKTNK